MIQKLSNNALTESKNNEVTTEMKIVGVVNGLNGDNNEYYVGLRDNGYYLFVGKPCMTPEMAFNCIDWEPCY